MIKTRLIKALLAASLVILILASVSVYCLARATPEKKAVAHHMSPNEYNITNGNVNEEMVHNGFDVGGMEETPTIGDGNLNRAESPWGSSGMDDSGLPDKAPQQKARDRGL